MKVSEMIDQTREIAALFDKVNSRHWGIEAMITELAGEVGTLADSVMIKESYRNLREGSTLDLEDDIVDIIFMLIRIADHYNVDLEKAYQQMIDMTREKLEKRIQESEQLE